MIGRTGSAVNATSAYELWVRTLRLWQEDANVPLHGLPTLDESALPPASWDRFMEHLRGAMDRSMGHWQESFVTNLTREFDEFRRGAVMVDARRALAKRLLLGRHPGLPERLRVAVWDAFADNIRSAQEQLESVARQGDGGLDPSQSNRSLTFFRTHALTVILAPGFPLEAFASGHHEAPAAVSPLRPQAKGLADQPFGSLPPGLASSRPRTIRF